ncbi:MAG: thiamine pyrophosphate-dependent dehydrogenase E1 component subunit alpha [Deltaproteobacteria bacterium]|nr:thiamine pyrophosphate-dependent dehydrogenase E1 component subunit alpha [Deltaproteobacteria bacterium]
MQLSDEKKIWMYSIMMKIRRFEEKLDELVMTGKLSGFVHLCIGQEAIAAGVCATLKERDYITSHHRGHGHLIAKGGKTDIMMAELFAKTSGYCKGKGGSIHLASMDLGILGANGIVGGGLPLGVGAGLAAQYREGDDVSVIFFGDGASNQGTVHESMNLAATWKLPVVFVAENNEMGELLCREKHQCVKNIADRAVAYDMPGVAIDGNDVIAVYETTAEAVQRARTGNGPTLVECKTFRIAGHFVGDPQVCREKDDIECWKSADKDPILRFENKILEAGVLQQTDVDKIRQDVEDEIAAAVKFAQDAPLPETEALLADVYAD